MAATAPPAYAAAAPATGGCSLERQAQRRMIAAIATAGLFALFASTAFYLIEVQRAANRQSAALAHYLGQIMIAAESRWKEQTNGRRVDPATTPWQYDPAQRRFLRTLRVESADGRQIVVQGSLDRFWLATQSRPDLRLFLATATGTAAATSLGDAGEGEAAALDPFAVGLVRRGDHLFVQVPQRWDGHPDSPILVAQQRLSLTFSLAEVAASGLLFWGFLAVMIWIAVGVWLKDALRHVQFLAYHDPLTGLINRAALRVGLDHMLAESRRNGDFLALLYLDLDRFKTINDSISHAAGDHVLAQTARRLVECVRDTDFVARMGGDEFVIALGELRNPEDATPIVRKAIQALAQPIGFHGRDLQVGTSIGIAIFPTDAADRDTLIKHADSAMYAAKQAGRGVFRYYDGSLGAQADQRLLLEERLREAIDKGRFEVHYQPIFACRPSVGLVGFEALLRWPDARQEEMTPERFIPVAEETGLILPLGDWALETACRQFQAWRAGMPERFAGVTLAVNISLKQLLSERFTEKVAAILEQTGLPPDRLELEIAESLFVERYGKAPAILAELRAMGLHLSIDDFGTGYSALASLSRLPVHRLKVDRSFVRHIVSNPTDLALVKAIVAIGRQLNIEIVAEGVESEAQMALLADADDRILMQGWLFGPALHADQVAHFVERMP
jgi:diguanylate cyclase (GGDEF)-like protein